MKRILSVLIVLVLLGVGNVYAHAPSSVDLTYDFEKQSLKIDVRHITQAIRKHYIRKIEVTKNNDKPKIYYYHWQKDNTKIERVVEVSAEAGDIFNVKVLCKKGGSKTASVEVEEPTEKNITDVVEDLPSEQAVKEPKGSYTK